MQGLVAALLVVLLPTSFVLMWLGITSLLGLVSGWYGLMRRYPDRDEPALVRLRGESGFMRGVNLRGVLSLAACSSGLRVSLWRGFGPFSKPFFVPWAEIAVERRKAFLAELLKLRFGDPQAGSMVIDARTWERLSQRS